MRRLAAPRDPVALDAERPEHDAEREAERLEHRPLLDVQLEVGGRVLELRPRLERAVEVDAVRGERVREARLRRESTSCRSSSWSAIEPAAALEPKRLRPKRAPSSSAQFTSRTVTGGLPSSAIRRRTSTPATTLRAPSSQPPFGTESMWPPIRTARSDAPGSVNHWLPAASIVSPAPVSATLPRSHARALLPGLRPGDALGAVLVARELAQLLQLGDRARRVERHGGELYRRPIAVW